jgi:ribosomal protein S17E
MAWDFFRRILRLMGSKVMVKLAPRLLFFQYYDHLGLEFEEQKRKFRILYQKSQA